MVSISWLHAFFVLACMVYYSQGQAFVKLCYFPNWAHQRASPYARFDVGHVDPSLCTHLVYAFASIDGDSGQIVPRYQDEDSSEGQPKGRYEKFNDIKKTNRRLKTLISIGGEFAGSTQFAAISKDNKSVQTFANNTVDFLRKRNFDGLDIDWEYPDAATKAHFTLLLKTLRTAFEADPYDGERLLLTAALPAGKQRIEDGFDIPALSRYLDLASLMTYDYHGGWSTVTGFDSPLFSRGSKLQFNQELSTKWTVDYYLSHGLEANKLLVGITAAGTHFRLQDPNDTSVGAPVSHTNGPLVSDIWQLLDRYAYPEICQVLQVASSHRVFDEEQGVPYVYQGDHWFGYEDVQSIQGKAEWTLKKGVAGIMFWALDMDDFTGMVCDNGTFPLLRALTAIVDSIENQGSDQLTTDSPTHPPDTCDNTCDGDSASRIGGSSGFICLAVLIFCWV